MRRWIMIAVVVVVGLRAGEVAAQYQPFDGLRPGVGAAIAGPATFGFFLALCNAFGDGECSEIGLVAAFGLAAGAGGALIGAGIGWMIPKWRLRYARDRDATVGLLLAPGRVGVAVRF